MEIYEYTPCKICAAEVPMKKTHCIKCKSEFLSLVAEYQDVTEQDMTGLADFLVMK